MIADKDKWIEDSVARETAGARKRVVDPEAAVQQAQDDTMNDDIAGLRSTDPDKTFERKLIAIGENLRNLASSDRGDDGEGENNAESGQVKPSGDDEPGWVMGTITKTVQQSMQTLRQKQMKLDELTQPWWHDAADYFCERDEKYGTSELRVPPVVQLQPNDDA